MPVMKNQIKMRDIARHLNISTVTVSRALRGVEGVGSALAREIREKAEKLGYQYNSLPRCMLTGQHYIIGVLIAEKYLEGDNPFYWHFFRQILAALKHRNYIGTLEVVTPEEESAHALPSFVKNRRIDGLIVLGQPSDSYLSMITGHGFPCVFLDFYSDIGGCDCFASNNVLASCNLTKLLLDKGHTNIAFVGSTAFSTGILDRYLGYSKAMHEAGLFPAEAIPPRNRNGE
jgi:LacI family transcriptional regulator